MPRAPCPEGMTRDAKTKECREKKKPGRKPKAAAAAPSKYTEEALKAMPYAQLVEIHKKMEASGKIVMRKGMKRDAAHLAERIFRKQ
jgi:hypothetical protein